MKQMLKWPLIVAAVLVASRVVLEQINAPQAVNMIFGVAWLYFLVPILFAWQIAASGAPKPFWSLLQVTAVFAACTRLMVMPTYWLAYALQWQAPRFSTSQGGVVGEGITPLQGYLTIPLRNAFFWIVSATVFGALIGGVTLLLRRRAAVKTAA